MTLEEREARLAFLLDEIDRLYDVLSRTNPELPADLGRLAEELRERIIERNHHLVELGRPVPMN